MAKTRGSKGFKEVVEKEDEEANKIIKFCPSCNGELFKMKDSGMGVKHCKNCNLGWFIIRTFRSKEKKIDKVEIDFQI